MTAKTLPTMSAVVKLNILKGIVNNFVTFVNSNVDLISLFCPLSAIPKAFVVILNIPFTL